MSSIAKWVFNRASEARTLLRRLPPWLLHVSIILTVLVLSGWWLCCVPKLQVAGLEQVAGPKGLATPSEVLQRENEARQTLATILGGMAVLLGVYLTWRRVGAAEEQVKLAREEQITERFTRAIDQLGSEKLEIRLGGIYALERIARDPERDHWTIVEVLSAYIRARAVPDLVQQDSHARISPDIQAALTVLGRRNRESEDARGLVLDLSGSCLARADLRSARLERADLTKCILDGANLEQAHMDEARLIGASLLAANLKQAQMDGVRLAGASLLDADLSKASMRTPFLDNAKLAGAFLSGADLRGSIAREGLDISSKARLRGARMDGVRFHSADLSEADLQGASLCSARLCDCVFAGATLEDADLSLADLCGSKFGCALLRGANLSGAKLGDASLHNASLDGAKLEGVDLSQVKGLTLKQLSLAASYEKEMLPDYLRAQGDAPTPE